jgi:drug/metabolite transporter (DMT)-like permease
MDKQKQAYIHATIAVLFWATVASAFKISLRYLDYIELLFYASISSIVALCIILLIQKKLKLLATSTKRDYIRSALLGFLNPYLYYLVLFRAYSLLTAQEAVTLNYIWPIMLALLSIPLLRQRIGGLSILAIVTSFIGVFIIATKGDVLSFRFTNPGGAALALGSAVIWALYWIFNIRDKRDEIAGLFWNFVFGFIYILITMLVLSKFRMPDIRGLMGGTYVGLFEMGVTFALWLRALKMSRTTAQVGNLVYAAPFLSLVVISFVVGEKILVSTITGLIFIVLGILLQGYFSRK